MTLSYRPARVRCSTCGIKVEALPWASGKSRLTSALMVVLATWARLLAWDVVARLFGVSWSTVQAAVAQAVDFGLAHRESACVVYIGIDEISRRRGHIYHTQVYDLTGKRLLWSAEGRDAATLRRFFEEWGAEKTSKIRGVCCDMWAPYMEVVRQALPGIPLVFDKFHLIRHLLKAVNEVRRGEAKELSKTHPDLLAGTRYLWLKNPSNLTPRQQQRLSYLERMNLKINRAYLSRKPSASSGFSRPNSGPSVSSTSGSRGPLEAGCHRYGALHGWSGATRMAFSPGSMSPSTMAPLKP